MKRLLPLLFLISPVVMSQTIVSSEEAVVELAQCTEYSGDVNLVGGALGASVGAVGGSVMGNLLGGKGFGTLGGLAGGLLGGAMGGVPNQTYVCTIAAKIKGKEELHFFENIVRENRLVKNSKINVLTFSDGSVKIM